MHSRTHLVALREYVENLRTKAFWIGILAFPVIIVISMVAGRLMAKAKDVRTYAVIDRSEGQWLSHEIEQRTYRSAIERQVAAAKAKATAAEAPTPAQLRAELQRQLDRLPADDPTREILTVLAAADDDELQRMSAGEAPSAAILGKLLPIVMRLAKDPNALRALAQFDAAHKFKRVEVDAAAADLEAALNQRIQREELFAYFVIGEHPERGSEGCRYVSNNLTDDDLLDWFTEHASTIVRERRIDSLQREKNLTTDEARLLTERLAFRERKVSATGTAEDVKDQEKASQFAPVAFVYLLWIAVFTAAQMLLTNTVEEKSNRLIEVLLSSVSPIQLMAGKVFGIAATGLTVVGSWVVCALLGVKLLPLFVPEFGKLELTQIVGDPLYLASFLFYFLAGYFLYAAILVGLGSVCNSLKEAQNLLQPVFIFLMVPLLAMIPVVQEPNGTLARVLTYIPLFTPFLMMNRAGGPPPAWEYVVSTLVIAIAVAVAFWAAAKIFRIGVLMTGKPPRIKEIFGWLRAPVGAVPVRKE